MNSSVGLSVNRMMTEPMSPMSDDSRLVTVWVSIVRTSVTSLDRRETSSPTLRLGVEVERQRHQPAEQVAPELGDDALADDAEQVRLEEAADRLDAEQPEQDEDEAIEAGRIAAGDHRGRDPGDDQREGETDERREDEPDHGDAEPPRVRAEVAEQASPRHAAEAADLADDGAGIGRDTGELLGHAAMMSPTPKAAWRRDGEVVEDTASPRVG